MMRGITLLLVVELLCLVTTPPALYGAANVTVTVNDHLSCSGALFTGMTNYVNFHIENDEPIDAASLAFEIDGYSGGLQWQEVGDLQNCTVDCYFEAGCRVKDAFDIVVDESSYSFDGALPDTIVFGAAAILESMDIGTSSDVVFRLSVYIPSGEPAGIISFDNIAFSPYAWEVIHTGGSSFPPDYGGCVNASTTDPDCPPINFPVIATTCGDIDGSGTITPGDIAALSTWLSGGGSEPCPPNIGDVTGDCSIDSLDLDRLTDMIFFGATGACTCEVVVPVCEIDTCAGQAPGDLDESGSVGIGDVIALTAIVYAGAPLPNPPSNADPNGDCLINVDDIEYLNEYITNGGPAPVTCTCLDPVLEPEDGDLCVNSTTDPVLHLCPGGDAPFHVYLLDGDNNPVVGDSSVWIEFMNCTAVDTCPGGTEISRLDPIAPSDASGRLTFYGAGGGCNTACEAVIIAPCGTIATVPVRSFDIDGDMGVSLAFDFDFSECNNYNAVPGIQFADQNLFHEHTGHFCGLSPCERFSASFSLDPASNLTPGQEIDLTLVLENNNFESCNIGFIGFFSSGFGTGGSNSLIENYNYNNALLPGETDSISVTYIVPGEGHGCLSVEFTTDCCSTTTVLEECAQSIWHCGSDGGVCYDVFIQLDGDPVENIVIPTTYLAPGWFVNITYQPIIFPVVAVDSIKYQICTPVDGQLGDDSRVPVEVWYDATGSDVEIFESQVFITPRTGDADGNCNISIGDAVYLINYIFGGGPAPTPCQGGDVDCSGAISIGDAVYVINFIFGGGPPPCIPDDGTPEPSCL